jgi:hypothetical protein
MITTAYLKTQIKGYNFETLTGGDDSVAAGCIRKAEIWVRAKLRKCGVEPDFTDEIDKESLTKRALYELYSFAENEDIAKDKKQDAYDLLRAKYGNCIDKDLSQQTGSQKTAGDPVGAVKAGSDNWQGFK